MSGLETVKPLSLSPFPKGFTSGLSSSDWAEAQVKDLGTLRAPCAFGGGPQSKTSTPGLLIPCHQEWGASLPESSVRQSRGGPHADLGNLAHFLWQTAAALSMWQG